MPDSAAAPLPPAPPGLARIAGYRVLRRLASSARADLYLAHGSDANEGGGHPVAVKVFQPGADPDSIEREIAVLGGAAPGRLTALIDVSTLPDGRIALVLERLAGGTLSTMLRQRGSIDPGEAVTILAPVVAALADLHQQGYSHTTLSLATVTFDGVGRPVVTGLGGIRGLPPFGRVAEAGRRFDFIRDDYARLAVLLRSVFDHLDGETVLARRAEVVVARFEMATTAVPFRPCLDGLEHELFAWSPATSVRLSATDAVPDVATAVTVGDGAGLPAGARWHATRVARALRTAASDAAVAVRQPVDLSPDLPPASARRWRGVRKLVSRQDGFGHTMLRAIERNPVETLRRVVGDRLLGGRPGSGRSSGGSNGGNNARRAPVLVAVFLAAAVSVLGLTLIPRGGVPTADGSGGSGEPGGRESPAVLAPVADDPAGRAAIAGDDPVLAVPALLRARAGCLAAASVVCLDGVDQAGSAALAMDAYSVQLLQQGAPAPAGPDYVAFVPALAERTGDVALVTLTPVPGSTGVGDDGRSEPASLLVIKGEAGWRLREIFDLSR